MAQLGTSLDVWKQKCQTDDQFHVVNGDIPDRSDTHLEFWKEVPKVNGNWLEMLECSKMFPDKQEFSFGVVRPQFTFGVNVAKIDPSNQHQRALLSNFFDVDVSAVRSALPKYDTADENNFIHMCFAYLNIIAPIWSGKKVVTNNKNAANPRIHFDWCHMANCLKKQGKLATDIGSYVKQVNAKTEYQKKLEATPFFGANPTLLAMFMQILKGTSAECASLHVNDAIADYYVSTEDGSRKDVDVDDGSCVMIFESPFPPQLAQDPLQKKTCSANDNFVAALNSLGHHLVKPLVVPPLPQPPSRTAQKKKRRKAQKKLILDLEKILDEQREQEALKAKLEQQQKKKSLQKGGDNRSPEQVELDREALRKKLHDKLQAMKEKRRGYK